MTTLSKFTGVPVATLWAVALLAGVASAAPALAADCKLTTRDKAESAQLGIRNGTERHLSVRFYRGSISEDKLKKTIVVKPGKREQYNYGLDGKRVEVKTIARLSLGGTDFMECYAQVANLFETEGSKVKRTSQWKEGGCTLLVSEPCPNCATTCSKSFNPAIGERGWRTTFKLTE